MRVTKLAHAVDFAFQLIYNESYMKKTFMHLLIVLMLVAASGAQALLAQETPVQLLGMTSRGGAAGLGTIYKIYSDNGEPIVLHSFNGADGAVPVESLTLASNGSLYGMTSVGGTSGYGTIFRIDADGSNYQVLHNFDYFDSNPNGSLTQTPDGPLTGMSIGNGGGSRNIFKINLDGSNYRIFTSFLNAKYNVGPAYGSVLQAGGWIYLMTPQGGTSDNGAILKISTNGTYLTGVHYFEGNDGAHP